MMSGACPPPPGDPEEADAVVRCLRYRVEDLLAFGIDRLALPAEPQDAPAQAPGQESPSPARAAPREDKGRPLLHHFTPPVGCL